jgi:hypothetical protein
MAALRGPRAHALGYDVIQVLSREDAIIDVISPTAWVNHKIL